MQIVTCEALAAIGNRYTVQEIITLLDDEDYQVARAAHKAEGGQTLSVTGVTPSIARVLLVLHWFGPSYFLALNTIYLILIILASINLGSYF